MYIRTWPDEDSLRSMAEKMPNYMRPDARTPIAVMAEGIVTKEECEKIAFTLEKRDTHHSPGCNADSTREIGHHPVLENLRVLSMMLNNMFFGFQLDEQPHSWMQTYGVGNYYQRHMDGIPGSTRKVTGVLMLSEPKNYQGGELTLYYHPESQVVNPTQGTIAFFPSWLLHEVSPVTAGYRQTINMGFFGPPFR